MNHSGTDKIQPKSSSIVVLGDAFADLVCHLDGPLPKEPGGDTRLESPITTMAGGSGLNTCTHLCSLMAGNGKVSLYTAVNESDPYGMLLCNHAKQHEFALYNSGRNQNNKSTGHCAVLVAHGDRSFLTHLGVMETFQAKDIDTNHILSSSQSDKMHVHVAGYYNIAGFWNGQLKATLQTIRDSRPPNSLITSLLCQYDATEAWDGQLMDLLPLVDYLFCNEVEVDKVRMATKKRKLQAIEAADDQASYWAEMAQFFQEQSHSTCVIVTLGPKGALALYDGEILARQGAPTSVDQPLDPTGAGDAFISGFLYGLLGLDGDNTNAADGAGDLPRKESVSRALQYGCAVGTSCISRMGASNPAPRTEIEGLMKKY